MQSNSGSNSHDGSGGGANVNFPPEAKDAADGGAGEYDRRLSRMSSREDWGVLDEYGKLIKYASTYKDPGKAEEEAEGEDQGEIKLRRVWYVPWKKRKERVRRVSHEEGQYPDDWLVTDIRQGLSTPEADRRRQRSGWNELVSEKENPFAKFLSYFKGPILYGERVFSC